MLPVMALGTGAVRRQSPLGMGRNGRLASRRVGHVACAVCGFKGFQGGVFRPGGRAYVYGRKAGCLGPDTASFEDILIVNKANGATGHLSFYFNQH